MSKEVITILSKVAPLFIKCQQRDIQKIREKIPGHGPQQVMKIYKSRVFLKCGCSLPISWLPTWEKKAVLALQEFSMEEKQCQKN